MNAPDTTTMETPLDQWSERAQEQSAKASTLEEVFLGQRSFAQYALFRLRIFWSRATLEIVLHIIEFFLFAKIIGRDFLLHLIIARLILYSLQGFWWGALEKLRRHIRDLQKESQLFRAKKIIGEWMGISLLCALLPLAAGIALLAWAIATRSPSTTYIALLVVKAGLDFIIRTYHSGAYAIRRIYRPLAVILGLQILSSLGSIPLFPLFGAWSLPLVFAIGLALYVILSFYYISRAYLYFGLFPLEIPLRPRSIRKKLQSLSKHDFVLPAIAASTMRFESLLFLLILFSNNATTPQPVVLFLYLLLPVFQANLDWTRLFYFDFSKLQIHLFNNLQTYFYRQCEKISLAIAATVWLIALLAAHLWQPDSLNIAIAIGPTLFILSLLSLALIHQFTLGAYRPIIHSSLTLIASSSFILWVTSPLSLAIFLLFIPCLLALRIISRSESATEKNTPILSLPQWIAQISIEPRPQHIVLITPTDKRSPWLLHDAGRRLQRNLPSARVTIPNTAEVLLSYHASHCAEKWKEALGGHFITYQVHQLDRATPDTIWNLLFNWKLVSTSELPLPITPSELPEKLSTQFSELFPDGLILHYAHGKFTRSENDYLPAKGGILGSAIFFSQHLTPSPKKRPDFVTSFSWRGELTTLFVASSQSSFSKKKRWSNTLREITLAQALHTYPPPPAE